MVFIGSVLGGSTSGFSSSARPFLNDLMPLAKSPIKSEILPRPPNSSRPTARTRIQCQMLIEPIRKPPHGRGHTGLLNLKFLLFARPDREELQTQNRTRIIDLLVPV